MFVCFLFTLYNPPLTLIFTVLSTLSITKITIVSVSLFVVFLTYLFFLVYKKQRYNGSNIDKNSPLMTVLDINPVKASDLITINLESNQEVTSDIAASATIESITEETSDLTTSTTIESITEESSDLATSTTIESITEESSDLTTSTTIESITEETSNFITTTSLSVGSELNDSLYATSFLSNSYQEPSFFTEMNERQVMELNRDLEPFGFAYYPKEDYFYSNMNCWQRSCGYCRLYDEACATLSMIIDCEPIYFDYDGRKWLIELWKGQYGLNTGCEIGVYNTSEQEPIIDLPGVFNGYFFNCAKDEDHLLIKFTLKKHGKILVTRSEKHWWLTAFKLGEFSHPKNLIMNCEITLKDQAMLNAFLMGLGRAGYDRGEYSVNGLTVRLTFDEPKTEQPATRTPIIEFIMQTNNKNNCEAYQYATRKFDNPIDKIESIKSDAPKLYRKIINVGNSSSLFDNYKTIKKFTDLKIMEHNTETMHMNE